MAQKSGLKVTRKYTTLGNPYSNMLVGRKLNSSMVDISGGTSVQGKQWITTITDNYASPIRRASIQVVLILERFH